MQFLQDSKAAWLQLVWMAALHFDVFMLLFPLQQWGNYCAGNSKGRCGGAALHGELTRGSAWFSGNQSMALP